MDAELDKALARKSRTVSLVIAGAILLWLCAQFLGPATGLPGRYALLFDFAALAALFWALVVTAQIWRARKASRTDDNS
ncbi:DUF5337 domain-containing protein [Sulfitobacter sp. D35]|uniref:DUF5337 domain-containing protein n=1 Tax=Sulfitobacter sp. D35 TaxID=3083252 RepID=UPI00296EDBD0|nr:DUF5337 domain-containing protein [Sulfitobacter sp. D35]MDW4496895.1 DUF5337 domain-containing protein [Sulfitobacter sp. D35]